MYKKILFDLDGTIIDPKEGITNSVRNALNYFKISVDKKEDLYKFIGPPLWDSFPKYYNFNEEETKIAVEKYREYFRVKGVLENKLYDGIEKLLYKLYKNNKRIFLATSKPEEFAIQIINNYGLAKYFTHIGGATMDTSRSKKWQVIQYVIKENSLNLEETIMIGDRAEDIMGANENHIDSIGILYGYGDYEELSKAGATYIVKDINELSELLVAIK